MSALRAPLLPRLRRHPLLWVLVAVVLLTKLVSASVCTADPGIAGTATPQAVVAAAPVLATDAGGCLLGEAACHCACAETLPIPATPATRIAAAAPVFEAPRIASAFVPAAFESPLRPPIA